MPQMIANHYLKPAHRAALQGNMQRCKVIGSVARTGGEGLFVMEKIVLAALQRKIIFPVLPAEAFLCISGFAPQPHRCRT